MARHNQKTMKQHISAIFFSLFKGTFVFSLLKYSPLKFNNTYLYPWWAYWLGWFLAMSSLSLIPITIVYKLYWGKGTFWQVSMMGSFPWNI
jgi:hypothetical protein